MSVSPSQTTAYTLTATGPGGTSTAAALVTIVVAPDDYLHRNSDCDFRPEGRARSPGPCSGADFVTIDQGIGSVFAAGTRSVSPTQATTIYHLTGDEYRGNGNRLGDRDDRHAGAAETPGGQTLTLSLTR